MVRQEILDEATRRLVTQFQPDKVILFGSQARGTATEESDVDLLVIGDYPKKDMFRLMSEMNRALAGLDIDRDIIILSPERFALDSQISGTIARPAKQEGRILYDRAGIAQP